MRIDTYNGVYFYRCNVEKGPTSSLNFRKALSHAIDRQAITEFVTKGGQQPAYAFTPPSESGYSPPELTGFDPEKAKQHLTAYLSEAGLKSAKEVEPFVILINTSESHKAIAVAIQAMWQEILGLSSDQVTIRNEEWKVYQKTILDQNYTVGRAGWIGDYLDPTTFLNMWRTGDSNNNTGWSSAEYDALMTESTRTSDPVERLEFLKQAEAILIEQAPVLPIYWYTRVFLIHPDVENWNPLLLDNRPYKFVRLGDR